jgi:RNA polymerase sigma-70 factor (ECF subfamily)
MYGVCLRYSRDATEAEDNLQDGFIKIFEKIDTFRHEGSFEGWIRRIMVNVSLEKYRKQNLLQTVDDISSYELPDLKDEIISEISANDLMKLIRELPPRYRMVFNLYVFEGMNHKEIAEEMRISEGTSKSNLARARIILKKQILRHFQQTENNYSA